MPGYWSEDEEAVSKGFLNPGESLSHVVLSIIIGLHVSCIVETVLWFRDQDSYRGRMRLVQVQVMYVIVNVISGLYVDAGGFGGAAYDAFFIYAAYQFANFAK